MALIFAVRPNVDNKLRPEVGIANLGKRAAIVISRLGLHGPTVINYVDGIVLLCQVHDGLEILHNSNSSFTISVHYNEIYSAFIYVSAQSRSFATNFVN